MAFDYAIASLVSLPSTHIVSRKWENLAEIKQLVEGDPLALVRCSIVSFGAQATAENIQNSLVPDVMTEGEWKKWWDNAKRLMRKDGLFHVPSKKNEAFRVLSTKVEAGVQSIEKFRQAAGLEQLLTGLADVI
jgi:transcription elongation factor GreA-like protein